MSTAFEDQLAAATAEADRILHAACGQTPRPETTSTWTTALLNHLTDTLLRHGTDGPAACDHLTQTPIQPAYTYSWEAHLRCLPCHTHYRAKQNPTHCDRCHSTDQQLAITLLRIRHLTVIAAVCQPCDTLRHHPNTPPEKHT
ncbi:DUF1631 domain-containing protein [Kitasatospora sp. A2-31]|uniref:DUF1631 domain-containing protein n=1 Tax=Kitasatospora sp. A2-31 TaxID=2916414 RepID=UPI001EEA08AF|nr:DUF1631 domain-containing protein [Kitasatospora sp. A2-31]MCG6497640.1 DUF1631 domain-containing protein [Kitasatospora sp. A2-31]